MDGPIKIGCTSNPKLRIGTLESMSPFPLEIIAMIDGCVSLEQRFHAKFRASHSHKEWFTPTPELLETISAVAAGTFDISTLPAPYALYRPWEARWGVPAPEAA